MGGSPRVEDSVPTARRVREIARGHRVVLPVRGDVPSVHLEDAPLEVADARKAVVERDCSSLNR